MFHGLKLGAMTVILCFSLSVQANQKATQKLEEIWKIIDDVGLDSVGKTTTFCGVGLLGIGCAFYCFVPCVLGCMACDDSVKSYQYGNYTRQAISFFEENENIYNYKNQNQLNDLNLWDSISRLDLGHQQDLFQPSSTGWHQETVSALRGIQDHSKLSYGDVINLVHNENESGMDDFFRANQFVARNQNGTYTFFRKNSFKLIMKYLMQRAVDLNKTNIEKSSGGTTLEIGQGAQASEAKEEPKIDAISLQ